MGTCEKRKSSTSASDDALKLDEKDKKESSGNHLSSYKRSRVAMSLDDAAILKAENEKVKELWEDYQKLFDEKPEAAEYITGKLSSDIPQRFEGLLLVWESNGLLPKVFARIDERNYYPDGQIVYRVSYILLRPTESLLIPHTKGQEEFTFRLATKAEFDRINAQPGKWYQGYRYITTFIQAQAECTVVHMQCKIPSYLA